MHLKVLHELKVKCFGGEVCGNRQRFERESPRKGAEDVSRKNQRKTERVYLYVDTCMWIHDTCKYVHVCM